MIQQKRRGCVLLLRWCLERGWWRTGKGVAPIESAGIKEGVAGEDCHIWAVLVAQIPLSQPVTYAEKKD